ncbi:MAG: hypothetical protein A3C35_02465 [Omnitrophica bacterium RIFCSPHIGHO2_02_FULL_46_11]|nr:MAG: hypothetical protein A3C35_02465 [Omnitrophica bacterium RIFCSPHIGHO2_02_FULL_46_11]
MGSSRLPGKVLKDLQGKPMLERVVERVARSTRVHEMVVITSRNPEDQPVASFCQDKGISCFRGSEEDVLDRFYQAAKEFKADAAVRITGDCPLIDPQVVDELVKLFLEKTPDYASNFLVRTFPRGLDAEIMTYTCLETAWKEAKTAYCRAHVTPYIYENPNRFHLEGLCNEKNYSDHRWTVDTVEDLNFVRSVYRCMGSDSFFSWQSVLDLIEREPALKAINAKVQQKEIHEG